VRLAAIFFSDKLACRFYQHNFILDEKIKKGAHEENYYFKERIVYHINTISGETTICA
jgi:hypothetical protein